MTQNILRRVSAGEDLPMHEMAATVGHDHAGELRRKPDRTAADRSAGKRRNGGGSGRCSAGNAPHMTRIRSDRDDLIDTCGTGKTVRAPLTSAPPRPSSRRRPEYRWPSTETEQSPARPGRPTFRPRWASTSKPACRRSKRAWRSRHFLLLRAADAPVHEACGCGAEKVGNTHHL